MRLSNFKFKLPEELIAQFPSRFRDEARMLVLHAKTGEIEHKCVSDLATYFEEGDIIVANDTKVFPARLYAKKEKTNANIEVFLLRELQHENRYWDVLVDPARKIRIGNKLFLQRLLITLLRVVAHCDFLRTMRAAISCNIFMKWVPLHCLNILPVL